MIYNFLFPSEPSGTKNSLLLLAVRIIFGTLLLLHGLQKLSSFNELSAAFPDPLGVGNQISLILAIFAEVFCSIGFILGVLYRLTLVPMIFTMCVAFFVVHGSDPFAKKELAFIYLIVFIVMYIAGPGKFAADRLFRFK